MLNETPHTVLFFVAIAAAVFSAGGAAVAIFWARRSWPHGVATMLDDLRERVVAAETTVEGLKGKWAALKVDYESFLEEAEGLFESVERKRRRIAASDAKTAQREEKEQGQQLSADPNERRRQLLQLARARGIAGI